VDGNTLEAAGSGRKVAEPKSRAPQAEQPRGTPRHFESGPKPGTQRHRERVADIALAASGERKIKRDAKDAVSARARAPHERIHPRTILEEVDLEPAIHVGFRFGNLLKRSDRIR